MKIKDVLPEEPPVGLLNSMALSYDHSFGIANFNEDEEKHKERQKRILVLMRKFYDEVSGYGYYKYPLDKEYILSEKDFKNLERFEETSSDNEGYDVSKENIERLAEIGVVRFHGKKIYSITSFGQFVLDVKNVSIAPYSLEVDEDTWNRFQENIKKTIV